MSIAKKAGKGKAGPESSAVARSKVPAQQQRKMLGTTKVKPGRGLSRGRLKGTITKPPLERMTLCQLAEAQEKGGGAAARPQGGEDESRAYPFPVLGVGIDSFDIRWHIDWSSPSDAGAMLQGKGVVRIAGVSYAVRKHPKQKWNSQGMTCFLEADDLIFGLVFPANPAKYHGLAVQARGMACMKLGCDAIHARAMDIIDYLNGKAVRETITRVDIRCDLEDCSVEAFAQAVDAKHYVTRVGHANCWVGKANGIYDIRIGPRKKGWSLHIYDKERELKTNHRKRRTTQELAWEGKYPDKAIRVEFRVKSAVLRKLGITTYADLVARRKKLVTHLSHKAFRFTSRRPRKGHAARTPLMPEWKIVQDAFDKWASLAMPSPKKLIAPDSDRLLKAEDGMKSIRGIFEMVAVNLREPVRSDAELLAFAREELMKVMDGESPDRVRQKRAEEGLGPPVSRHLRERLRRQREWMAADRLARVGLGSPSQ